MKLQGIVILSLLVASAALAVGGCVYLSIMSLAMLPAPWSLLLPLWTCYMYGTMSAGLIRMSLDLVASPDRYTISVP